MGVMEIVLTFFAILGLGAFIKELHNVILKRRIERLSK